MSDKLIGAVSLKVKPDTKNFRDEAERDLKKQLRGMDDKVTIKGQVDYDTEPAKRKLNDLKREARESITMKVDVDGLSSQRWADYAKDAKKHLRDINTEMRKLDSDASNGLASNWAKRKGQLRKEAAEYKGLLGSILEQSKNAGSADKSLGFEGIQAALDKLHASQQRVSKISATSWDDTAKAVERYRNALSQLSAHEKNDDGSMEWTSQGVQLLDAVETMERQVASLKEQDATLVGLQRRWDSLGKAQKSAISEVMTSENNADIERAKQDIDEFRASLQGMSTMQVANLRKARMEAEKMAAVEAEMEARRRRLRAQKAFTEWESNTTATPENQNIPVDEAYLRTEKVREYARELEKLTAVELKRLEKVSKAGKQWGQEMTATEIAFLEQVSDADVRHNLIREEANRRRRQANFNGTQFDTSRQLADMNRVERENLAHQSRMVKATEDYYRTVGLARQKHYNELFGLDFDLDIQSDLDKLAQKYKDAMKPGAGRAEWEKIKLTLDDESINKVKQRYEQLKREIEDIEANVIANPTGFMAVAAQLSWLTRPRTVNIFAQVHGRSLAVAKDSLKSLAGLNVASNVGKQFEDAFRNLDDHILKLGKLGVVLGSVSAGILGAAGAIGSIGAGLAESVGLLALLPTAVYAGAASFGVFKIAFADFANAFSDIPIVAEQAMKDLPPLAKKAVEELRGTWSSIRVPVQEAFWGQMGDSIGQLKKRIIPQVRDGLKQLAPEAAKATKGVLDSYLKIADNGDMKRMLDNTGKMMSNAAKGAEPLFDAINRIGLRGSEYLPQFGTWLADGAKSFDEWIKKADEAGKIDQWIEDGIQSVKDFGSAIGGTSKILGGFAKAAADAGGPSLGDLAKGLNNVGDSMNREPFKSRMSTLFDGAFRGVENLTGGLKAMGTAVGESADFWADMLDVTTKVAAVNMTNLSRILSNDYAQSGMLLAFEGMHKLAQDLTPAFDNVAQIIGDVGRVANASFDGLAPIINTIVESIADVVSNLSGGAIAAIPALTGQINSGLTTLGAVLGVVSTGLGNILEGFGSLPAPIQQATTGLAAFLLLRGSLGRMMTTLGNTGPIKKMRDEFNLAGLQAGKTADELSKVGTATVVMSTAGNRVKDFGSKIRDAGTVTGSLKTIGGGLMSMLGGPWGLALGAATVATTMWASAQAEAKQKAENLKATLDPLTGKVTEVTAATLHQDIESNKANWWQKHINGYKDLGEVVGTYGLKSEELARIVSEGGAEYDELYGTVSDLDGAMNGLSDVTVGHVQDWGQLGGAIEGIDSTLNGSDIRTMKTWMEENRGSIDEGQMALSIFNREVENMSGVTGMGVGAATQLNTALSVLSSETANADQKVQALKVTLDNLKGGQLSAQQAARNLAKAWEGAISSLDGIDKSKVKFKSFFDEATGQFTRFDGDAGKIYDASVQISDAILTNGQAAYQAAIDQGKTAADASKAAVAAMEISDKELKKFAENAGMSVEEARSMLTSFMGENWEMQAIVGLDSKLFMEEKQKAEAAGEEFTQEKWEAILSARGADAEAAIKRAELAGVEFAEKDYQAVLKGTDDQFNDAVTRAKEVGVEFTAELYTAMLSGDPTDVLVAAQVGRDAGIDFSQGLYEATLAGKASHFIAAVRGAGEKGREFADAIYEAYLKANPDPAKRSAEAAEQFAEAFARGDYSAVITASNKDALSKISAAAKKGKDFSEDDYKALLKALDKTSPGTAAALRTITGMTKGDYKAAIKALNSTKPGKDSAQRTINSTKGKTANIDAANKTAAGKKSVDRSLGDLNYQAEVRGRYKGWVVKPIIKSLSVAVKGVWNGLFGGPGSAHGTILSGAKGTPQKFDSTMPAWKPAYSPLKAFADGGIESHVAQIAGPSTHSLRVWAEPETGGEAYIPLAASKRTRSVAIWQETGRRLGVYANGGMEGAQPVAERPQQTFNITNNYPVAEKTSTTINRALEFAGAPGISDF